LTKKLVSLAGFNTISYYTLLAGLSFWGADPVQTVVTNCAKSLIEFYFNVNF